MTDRIIWTSAAIGQRVGVSGDYVRDRLAKAPGTPVKRDGRRYYAVESDLVEYFRRQPVPPHPNQ